MLTTEIANAQHTLAEAQAAGDAAGASSAQTVISDLQKQLDGLNKIKNTSGYSNIGAEMIAGVRQAISAIDADTTLSTAQRYAQERQLWQQLLDGDRLNAKQRGDVIKTMNQEKAAYERLEAKEVQSIISGEAQTEIDMARDTLAQKKSLLDQELKAHEITADEWNTALQSALAQEEQLDIAALQNKYANRDKDRVEYATYLDELLKLYAKYWQDVAAQDRAGAAAHHQELMDEINQSKAAFADITQASDSMISDMLTSNKTFAQAATQIVAQLATKEIEQFARAALAHIFYSQEELAADRSLGGQSVIWNALFEDQQTAATAAGAAARAAANQAAASAGTAAQATAGSATIMNDAKQAAAGAYAAVSQIPVIGPFLAPAAAAAAFVGVMAFDTLTSAAGGQYEVPGGGGLYQLHAQESVLPANIASPMRNFFESGAASQGQTVQVHFNLGFVDGRGADSFFKANGRAIAATIAQQVRNMNSNLSFANQT